MKKLIIFITLAAIAASGWSCTKEKLDPDSRIIDKTIDMRPFDNWLTRELRIPYNIELKYRADEIDLGSSDQVTPAKEEGSKIMAVLLKHLWLDAYSEASPSGVDFIKQCATREIHLFGSSLFQNNGTRILGTAAGGKKMTLYDINGYSISNINTLTPEILLGADNAGVFHTIHHEFAHILHQLKPYNESAFNAITPDIYVGESWFQDSSIRNAISAGCITPYGRSSYIEDFVEILSTYIGLTPAQWSRRLAQGSDEGQAFIAVKLEFIRVYLKQNWNIELDVLRDIVIRRATEISRLEFTNLE